MRKNMALFLTFVVVLSACIAYGSDMQTVIRNSDAKLKANGFLLDEEIEEIWQAETTPDVIKNLTDSQQKAIDAELKQAQDIAEKTSLDFGKNISDPLEQSMYQEGVRKNKVLKATREIAEKYSIKAGDVFVISNNLFLQTLNK